jgi:hypothetical protein
VIALGACNAITGVDDLMKVDAAIGDGSSIVEGGTVNDGAAEALSQHDGGPGDAAAEIGLDAPAPDCGVAVPTVRLGVAEDRGTYVNLTPLTVGVSGGIASATPVALGAFVASFDFAILAHVTSNGTNPAAGITFFALSAPSIGLPCKPGPNICTLGGPPGFAVVLRTARGDASDPEPPWIAVLDAPTFPTKQPSNPTPVAASLFETEVGTTDASAPPPDTAWHKMAIVVKAGTADVAIDGKPVLTSVPIPGYAPGLTGTWGVGASTGLTSGAERNAVRNLAMATCAP